MSELEDIRKRKEERKGYCYESEQEVQYSEDIDTLLSLIDKYEKAISEFTVKHFHGGSKANRTDYVNCGIPTADIYKLWESIRKE